MPSLDIHSLFGYSTLTNSPGTAGTSFTVQAGDGALFAAGQNVTIWPASVQPTKANAEIGRITAIATDTLTVTRAQEGTTAKNAQAGWQIDNSDSPKVFTDIENALNQKTVVTVGTSAGADYVCDGTGDDVEILAAVSTVNSAGGGTVFVKAGTYNLANPISLNGKSMVRLRGDNLGTIFQILCRPSTPSAAIRRHSRYERAGSRARMDETANTGAPIPPTTPPAATARRRSSSGEPASRWRRSPWHWRCPAAVRPRPDWRPGRTAGWRRTRDRDWGFPLCTFIGGCGVMGARAARGEYARAPILFPAAGVAGTGRSACAP
jgi:hypothetical protein